MAATETTESTTTSPAAIRWYALTPDEVVSRLSTDIDHGLSAAQAAAALKRTGPNALPEERPRPGWLRFLDEYRSFMQVILVVAAVVSALIQEWSTALMLLALTVLNAIVGLREEGKAESAMNALKSMMKSTARVRRDGAEASIPADQLVVGDVVLLSAGDQVPADGRLVAASSLQIDESALTGESVPAGKDAATLPDVEAGPGDRSNIAFMNTPVTHGSGVMVVTATGARTEVGRISGLLGSTGSEQTPLQHQLTRMTQWIALAALVTMVVMFAVGLQRGEDPKKLFVIAIALAIAAIPEALPTVVQVILSLGAVGLAKRDAIVKDLSSVETLGSTSAINSDKTGTLTMNQMTAVEIVDLADRYTVTGVGYGLQGTLTHAAGTTPSIDDAILPYVIASDATLVDGTVVGDPTEGALLVLAHKAQLDIEASRAKLARIATLPFDPTYKIMAAFTRTTDENGAQVVRAFIKGAGPAMLDRAGAAVAGAEIVPWNDDLRNKADSHVVRMEGDGLRVMAAGRKDIDPASFDPQSDLLSYLDGITITSLVGMIDPPRDSSKKAVADAQAAHIRVRMVTGDDVTTGAAVAQQLGIPGEAILGADFAALSDRERLARIDGIGVVGRVAPEHKVLLVETLRSKGEVVAMTGDGVNDAPAIKAADIGIAMGSGTEVAKNAGRMILTNDDFATIVFAVEQGRTLYDNLMKYVRFILITLVAFVLMFLGATIFDIAAGEPFTPGQILWINFLIDMPLGIALGFDLETPGLMDRPPRPRKETILHTSTLVSSLLVGLFMAATCLYLLDHGETVGRSLAVGTTMALWAFLWFRIVCTLESRSLTGTIFRRETFDCRQINVVIVIEFVLGFLVADAHVLNTWLGTARVGFEQWFLAFVPAVALLLLWEIGKAISRRAGVVER